MVLLGLAAGAVAGSSALSTFGYNREAWMTDIQVKQARRYQRQSIRLSQVEMFREDIRDLVGASVAKQNNYVIVATLLLGMVTDCYLTAELPDNAAMFATCAYMLTIAVSLLYLVLSVMCAVGATTLASQCQKDLLVKLVRLPTHELAAEVEDAAPEETVEAFENQSVASMFRLPGLSRLTELASSGVVRTDSRLEVKDAMSMRASEMDYMRMENDQEDRMQHLMTERVDSHLALFHEKEMQWETLGQLGFMFGGMGLSHLLQAYSYYSAMKYYDGDTWASIVVPLMLTILDAGLLRTYLLVRPCTGIVGWVVLILAPLACLLSIRIQEPCWLHLLLIPTCYFCHFLWNCLLAWRIHEIVQEAVYAGAVDDDASEGGDLSKAHLAHACASSGLAGRRSSARGNLGVGGRKLHLFSLGTGIVVSAWLSTLIWSIDEVVHFRNSDGFARIAKHAPRKLHALEPEPEEGSSLALPEVATAEQFDVTWPSQHFRPHAVACGDDGTCFVANEYSIFRMNATLGAGQSLLPQPCAVVGKIADVAAICEGGRCRPWALVRNAMGAAVVDCDLGMERPLLREKNATGIAARGGTSIFTLHSRRVVQRSSGIEPQQKGWLPLWSVAEVESEAPVAMDFAATSGGLVLFYGNGHMELLHADSNMVCSSGVLPDGVAGVLLSASVAGPGAAFALLTAPQDISTQGPSVQLWQIDAPWLMQTCKSFPEEDAVDLIDKSSHPRFRGLQGQRDVAQGLPATSESEN